MGQQHLLEVQVEEVLFLMQLFKVLASVTAFRAKVRRPKEESDRWVEPTSFLWRVWASFLESPEISHPRKSQPSAFVRLVFLEAISLSPTKVCQRPVQVTFPHLHFFELEEVPNEVLSVKTLIFEGP